MESSKFLSLARQARAENNSEDAKNYYAKVREEDPENIEAKFYYSYYCLYEGKNGEIPTRFTNMCTVLNASLSKLKSSNMSVDGQLVLLGEIAKTFVPETAAIYNYMLGLSIFEPTDYRHVVVAGMEAICKLGDFTDENYSDQKKGNAVSVYAWKEYVSLAQTKFFFSEPKEKAEEYAGKIKKYEPTYEMPARPSQGCGSK